MCTFSLSVCIHLLNVVTLFIGQTSLTLTQLLITFYHQICAFQVINTPNQTQTNLERKQLNSTLIFQANPTVSGKMQSQQSKQRIRIPRERTFRVQQQSMNKNKGNKQEEGGPPTAYKFYLGSRERYIHIDCTFESGNIQLVRQLSEFNYRLSCVDDGVRTGHRANSKSWFYFRVHGFPRNTKGKFAVSRLQTLLAVYSQYPKSYRPVFRDCVLGQANPVWSQWTRVATESPLILRESGELECVFQFPFRNEQHCVEFAFTYPYSYSRNIEFLNALNDYYYNDEFYFHKEVLIRSPENRDIHLITITSHDQPDQQIEQEELFDQILFPEKCRPKRFRKPVVLISGRVHPGETAASFAMEGVINFLVNSKDLRSYLLRKMFVFMIVPMINVDGVFHGHFRMDGFGKNLNRYYIDPQPEKQPAVYAIKQLAKHLVQDGRLSFYFDLHAHNARKGAFIYGNAINDFVQQVESQVFCKLFALNHAGFQYECCNFSMKQMNSKDRNEDRTKQGCGRVVMHRIGNIIHSYSLECGIISASKQNQVPPAPNHDFRLGGRGLEEAERKQNGSEPFYFTQDSYRDLGKSMMVSILDVFDKNPYNRVYNSHQKSMEFLRRVTAFEVFHTAQRFRMFQKYVYGKVKNINQLIREVLNSKLHYRELYNFYFYNNQELKNTQWPDNIPGLTKPKFTQKLKLLRSLQEPKLQYSLSFINALKTNRDQLEQSKQGEPPQAVRPIQQDSSFSSETETQGDKQEIDTDFVKEMMEGKEVHSEILIPEGDGGQEEREDINSWKEEERPWLGSQKQICNSEREWSAGEECESTSLQKITAQAGSHKVAQLKLFENGQDYDCQEVRIPANQSPSVRVRRLLKNDGQVKKTKITTQEMKGKLSEMIANSPVLHSPILPQSSFMGSNTLSNYGRQMPQHERQMRLFEEIKMEIKEQLRRQKQRTGVVSTAVKPQIKSKNGVSEIKYKDRIRSTNHNFKNLNLHGNHNTNGAHHKHKSETLNRQPSKSSIGKTQLPALNSHILIITSNSSKGLVVNQ